MCLILFAWRTHPDYPLVFAGNRDEAYTRPSAAADFWDGEPRIYGGRDLQQGGTWLGLSVSGRIAAVTNYRERPSVPPSNHSRGDLAAAFLTGSAAPRAYLEQVARTAAAYRPFSLLVGDGDTLWYFSNRGGPPQALAPGVHGLSNHLLDTPWPKVTTGKARLGGLLAAHEDPLVNGLFEILSDRTEAGDLELPQTGVGLQRERELSPLFIAGDHYGTRASTVLLIGRDGGALFIERTFGPGGAPLGVTRGRLDLEPAPQAMAAATGQ